VVEPKKNKNMGLKFAFAVNSEGFFSKKHFGDTYRFLIYEVVDNKLVHKDSILNDFSSFDEEQEHGSKKKAKAIMDFLKEKDVGVMVSMQFGKNVKRINELFIPIIIYSENIQESIDAINKHMHWILDEWSEKQTDYKLFTIKSGILKSVIKKK